MSFVRNALANRQSVERAYFGKVPVDVAEKVEASTGIQIEGFQVMLNGNDVRHIIKSHGDVTVEMMRNQIAVTAEDIALIPEVISAPDNVYKSGEKDGKGRTVIVFEKDIGGRYITMQGVSDGKYALETDTLYIQKQKSSQDAGHNAAESDPVSNAQSVPPQNSSTASIPASTGKVKGGLAYDALYADRVTRAMAAGGKGTVRPSDFMKLDRVCRELGVQARFVDGGEVLGGEGNAVINGDEILVARDHQGALRAVLGHELTHRMQQVAPEEYRAFRDVVAQDVATANDIRYKMELYASKGVTLSIEEALDEAAADYAGQLIEDGKVLDKFIEKHRTDKNLLEKLLDAIRGIIAKLTGAEKRQAQTAEGKLAAALDAAAANVAAGEGQETAARESGGERYAIRELENGGRYVQADRQVIFGNDPASWREQLENYINGKIRGGQNVDLIADDGEVLTLTEDTAGKISSPYTSHGTTLPEETYYTKINAGAHIDELAQVSKGRSEGRADRDGRHGAFAAGGWKYRTAYFCDFDGKYYRLTLSVARGTDGNVVYNIGDIRERSFPNTTELTATGSSTKGGALSVEETSSTNSIPKKSGGVNKNFLPPLPEQSGDYSLKGGSAYLEEARRIEAQAKKEEWSNERLQEELQGARQKASGELLKETKKAAREDAKERKLRGPPTETETAAREGGEGKMSIETLPDGERITVVDQGQEAFDGQPKRRYAAIVRNILLEQFAGKTLPLGEYDLARLEKAQAGEYAYPRSRYAEDSAEYEGKMRAAPELDHLLETAEYSHWAPDRTGHPEATLGFDYYNVRFIVGGHLFEGLVNIANSEKGRVFYDVTKVKEIPDASGKYVALMARSTSAFGALFGDSVPQAEGEVKGKFSREVDLEYSKAVQTGDMETAERLTKKAAEQAFWLQPKPWRRGNSFAPSI